jgi:predicted methyltransferase
LVSPSARVLSLFLVACGPSTGPPPAPSAAKSNAANVSPPKRSVPSTTKLEVPPHVRAAVDATDRDPEDRKLDAGRRPAEMLTFFGIRPGMKVAELAAGGGYTAELLARTVGPEGVVYGHNSPLLLEKFAQKPWDARLSRAVNKPIVRVTRELEDPFPPGTKDLDAVFCVLFYHDTVWLDGVDRGMMNAAVLRVLKRGGVFAVIDHSGRPGTGTTEVKTLHRIEERVVREEIERAGFRLAAEADFLRNPADARDWNAAPTAAADRRGTSDRFVLSFVKP